MSLKTESSPKTISRHSQRSGFCQCRRMPFLPSGSLYLSLFYSKCSSSEFWAQKRAPGFRLHSVASFSTCARGAPSRITGHASEPIWNWYRTVKWRLKSHKLSNRANGTTLAGGSVRGLMRTASELISYRKGKEKEAKPTPHRTRPSRIHEGGRLDRPIQRDCRMGFFFNCCLCIPS